MVCWQPENVDQVLEEDPHLSRPKSRLCLEVLLRSFGLLLLLSLLLEEEDQKDQKDWQGHYLKMMTTMKRRMKERRKEEGGLYLEVLLHRQTGGSLNPHHSYRGTFWCTTELMSNGDDQLQRGLGESKCGPLW